MEKDISYVFCVLYQHSVGECELTLHSSFFYADNKVIHSCNHRSGSRFTYKTYFLYRYSFVWLYRNSIWFLWIWIVVLQWVVWRKYFDWRIWASLVPIVGGILLTSMTELSFNMLGFCAALFGCLATSTKTILAESLLHGYKFDRYSLFYCLRANFLPIIWLWMHHRSGIIYILSC